MAASATTIFLGIRNNSLNSKLAQDEAFEIEHTIAYRGFNHHESFISDESKCQEDWLLEHSAGWVQLIHRIEAFQQQYQ